MVNVYRAVFPVGANPSAWKRPATAPDLVFTVLTYGPSPLYGPPLVRNFSSPGQQTSRSPRRAIGYARILSQVSHWVLAAWGSRETGAGVAAGGHGPALLATGVLPMRRPAP